MDEPRKLSTWISNRGDDFVIVPPNKGTLNNAKLYYVDYILRGAYLARWLAAALGFEINLVSTPCLTVCEGDPATGRYSCTDLGIPLIRIGKRAVIARNYVDFSIESNDIPRVTGWDITRQILPEDGSLADRYLLVGDDKFSKPCTFFKPEIELARAIESALSQNCWQIYCEIANQMASQSKGNELSHFAHIYPLILNSLSFLPTGLQVMELPDGEATIRIGDYKMMRIEDTKSSPYEWHVVKETIEGTQKLDGRFGAFPNVHSAFSAVLKDKSLILMRKAYLSLP